MKRARTSISAGYGKSKASTKRVWRWRQALVVFVILLVPVWLTDPRPAIESTNGPQTAGSARPVENGRPRSSQRARVRDVGGLDRTAFLESFETQAGDELVPCLRESMGPRGSVTLMARLSRAGRLSAIRLLDPAGLEIECAAQAIGKMQLREVGQTSTDESLEIKWRFDW